MRHWFLRLGLALLSALLLVGCGAKPSAEPMVESVQQTIEMAGVAAELAEEAAAAGNPDGFRTAYESFTESLESLLAPVSMEDPNLAARLANAHSAVKAQLSKGSLNYAKLQDEMAVIRSALERSVATMALAAAPQEKITVVAREHHFEPKTIKVKKGTRVTIRLENRGKERHEFEIDALGFELGPIDPGKYIEGSFMADKPGRYSYECHVDGHAQKGMRGTLIIEE